MLTGKRAILESLVNNPYLVRIMREVNNCVAAGTGCRVCTVRKLSQCWSKARAELQKQAYKKYMDKPEIKREHERFIKENKQRMGE